MRSLGPTFIVLLLFVATGCERATVMNYYSSNDVQWGEPVQLTEYIGKQFTVVGGVGPGRNGFFPLTVPREDGSVTYMVQVQFMTKQLRMINYCIYQDHTRAIVATLTAQVDAPADQIENGYVISHPQESKTAREGKMCGVQLAPGKYLLLKNNTSLRMYADPKYFMELVPSTSN